MAIYSARAALAFRPVYRRALPKTTACVRLCTTSAADTPARFYSRTLQYLHWGMGGGVIACLGLTWAAKDAWDSARQQHRPAGNPKLSESDSDFGP